MTSASFNQNAGSQGVAGPLILVVEDHEDTRFLLRTWLEMQDYRVIEARDGEDALRLALAKTPDLILMDLGLPRLDGLSATRRMRECDELRTVPIVFLSGHAYPADLAAGFAAGCDDYLVKPLNLDQLDNILEGRLKPQYFKRTSGTRNL
jgi:DNA-binding response OmpR family regulator